MTSCREIRQVAAPCSGSRGRGLLCLTSLAHSVVTSFPGYFPNTAYLQYNTSGVWGVTEIVLCRIHRFYWVQNSVSDALWFIVYGLIWHWPRDVPGTNQSQERHQSKVRWMITPLSTYYVLYENTWRLRTVRDVVVVVQCVVTWYLVTWCLITWWFLWRSPGLDDGCRCRFIHFSISAVHCQLSQYKNNN